MDKILKDNEYLEKYLPYSLPVLGRQLSGDYIRFIIFDNEGVAVLCPYDELILFLHNTDNICRILERINNEFKEVRIILYTDQEVDTKVFKEKYEAVEENFLINKLEDINNYEFLSNTGRFAGDNDISDLVRLEKSYIDEEIGWRKEERKKDLHIEYREKVKRNQVFINGEPVNCKIEIKYQYKQYMEIGKIYTDASQRQKGIAANCMENFLKWAALEQLTVVLNTRKDNTYANKLYTTAGFSKIGSVFYLIRKG